MEEFIAVARRKGLREVGFADHVPIYWLSPRERDAGLAMSLEELPLYVAEVMELSRKNPDLTVRVGLEVEFIAGFEETVRELLKSYSFDYVLGSVHYLDGWGFDNPALVEEYRNRDIDLLYEMYFNELQRAAKSGLFNVMAHPDLIKKFGYRPRAEVDWLYEETARVFRDAGVCAEVNTAGLRAPVGEIYPAPSLLRAFKRFGVPVTLGSDAHSPVHVGWEYGRALKLIEEAGYREIATFEKGRLKFLSL